MLMNIVLVTGLEQNRCRGAAFPPCVPYAGIATRLTPGRGAFKAVREHHYLALQDFIQFDFGNRHHGLLCLTPA